MNTPQENAEDYRKKLEGYSPLHIRALIADLHDGEAKSAEQTKLKLGIAENILAEKLKDLCRFL